MSAEGKDLYRRILMARRTRDMAKRGTRTWENWDEEVRILQGQLNHSHITMEEQQEVEMNDRRWG